MKKVMIIKGYEQESQLGDQVTMRLETLYETSATMDLNKLIIKSCSGCNYCQIKNPGICCIEDGFSSVIQEYIKSDTVFIVSPIRFGCVNAITKKFIDRTEILFLPFQVLQKKKTVMKPRYQKYPDLVFIGLDYVHNEQSNQTFRANVINSNLALASVNARAVIFSCEEDMKLLQQEGNY